MSRAEASDIEDDIFLSDDDDLEEEKMLSGWGYLKDDRETELNKTRKENIGLKEKVRQMKMEMANDQELVNDLIGRLERAEKEKDSLTQQLTEVEGQHRAWVEEMKKELRRQLDRSLDIVQNSCRGGQ